MGKFVISQAKNGVKFNLKAANGEVIASSQVYKDEKYCRKGIASVINNAPVAPIEDQTAEGFTPCKHPKFEVYKDKAGEFRFRLKATNGQIIATGEGYKGMVHQPDPEKKPDMLAGILAIRHMHMRAVAETGLTAADEMLYPENWRYLSDILSYVAVGARSVENQQHRLTASGMDIPVGMKNPTSGDFSVMMNSVIAAQNSHNFIYRGMDVTTEGNDLAHVILRGGVDKYGTCIPNYHYEDLVRLVDVYAKKDLKNPAAIIDANHSNSNKQFKEQIRIVSEILHSRRYNDDVKKMVKGVMIESYIEEGNQKICDHMTYGKSITDPCLGWEDTEKLIYKIAEEC